jgi:hypothetical protein
MIIQLDRVKTHLILGKFCCRTPQKCVICWCTPQQVEFAQYHYKFGVLCCNTLHPLFYYFLVFAEREGEANAFVALIFNLRLFIDF